MRPWNFIGCRVPTAGSLPLLAYYSGYALLDNVALAVVDGSLGTFMAAEGRHFSPETVKNMQVALDLAWTSLSAEQQAQSSKTTLATRILDAAEAGERSPARLFMLALMSASGGGKTTSMTHGRLRTSH